MNNKKKQFSFLVSNHLSNQEKEFFIKRLAYLLKAGVPILKSLTMIREQTHSNRQKRIIDSLIQSVANGNPIYVGLQRFKKTFGDFIINVIRVGENTGLLHQNLNYLAEELKKGRLLKQKITGALVYPIFIALTTIGITSLLIIFVFPKILHVLTSLKVPLPVTTKILISVSNFLVHYGIHTLIGLIIFIVIMGFISRLPKVQIFINNIIPSIPIIGQLLKNYNLTNITRTMGVLLKGGVTLMEALKITAETTPNIVYKKMLEKMAENILKGKTISNQFENYPRFFPILIAQMLSVGETTGNLSGSLLYLAEFYESEVDEMTKNLSKIIEPFLMILMGILVGFIVISIITPIYEITQYLDVK